MKIEVRKGCEIFSGTLTNYHFNNGALHIKLVGIKEPVFIKDRRKVAVVRLSRATMQNRKFIILESDSFEYGSSIHKINQDIANKEGKLL